MFIMNPQSVMLWKFRLSELNGTQHKGSFTQNAPLCLKMQDAE